MKRLLLILIALATLSGCNVVRLMEKRADRSFRKAGLEPHTFHDGSGLRSVWSTSNTAKPDLVLIHGITARASMWSKNVKRLSSHFDLILPELIGHGRTTVTWSGNSIDAQVAHVHTLLDSLERREQLFVVGNSYGGAIAANYAEQHPERVKGLIIYDGPASDYTGEMADSIARSVGAEDVRDLFTPQNADEQQRLISLSVHKKLVLPRFVLRQINDHMKIRQAEHLALLDDLLRHEDEYSSKRYHWSMPVHVLWGEDDRLIPVCVGEGIARRNSLGEDRLLKVPEAGHVSNIEQARVFESLLLRAFRPEGSDPD
ncbi:MAG: alpha/beta hydrolase [Flavobacteriales bacterium]|nr:alpha/beta hydrolase [Flavobacteriales bacterium]